MADRTDASLRWERAAKLLCVRLDSIGDVLMTTPAIRALKESRADRRITVLTSRAGAAIARLVPEIDDVIVYDAPWVKSPDANGIEDLAIIAAWGSEKDLACQQLGIALKLPGTLSYGQLKLLPYWDPLRGYPPFEKIVQSLAPK